MEALAISLIAKLAFQQFLESGAEDLGKKFTQEALKVGLIGTVLRVTFCTNDTQPPDSASRKE